MSLDNAAGNEELRWKSKYLNNLEHQEREEKVLSEKISILRRGLVSVSLAGNGLDPRLDTDLSALRSALRQEGGGQNLAHMLSQVEQSVLRLDTRKEKSAESMHKAMSSVLDQLINLRPLSRATKSPLKAFTKQIQQKAKGEREQAQLVVEFSALLRNTINELTQLLEKNKEPGFWGKVLSRSEATESQASKAAVIPEISKASDSPKVSNTIAAQEALEVSKGSKAVEATQTSQTKEVPTQTQNLEATSIPSSSPVSSAEDAMELDLGDDEPAQKPIVDADEPGFSAIAHQIEYLLMRIIDNITIPEHSQAEAENLVLQINNGLQWFELSPALENIAALVSSSTGQERNDFQQFLNSVNERLELLQEFLRFTESDHEQGKEAGEQLDKSVRAQVGQIANSVESANDLDVLKNNVQNQLDTILSSMDRFNESEEQREANVANELRQLVTRIDSMEQESRQFRTHLKEQQANAMKDALTSLPNRAAYEERLKEEFENWKHSGKNLCMVVGDVDFFKNVNDTYGHLTGDKVLKILAKEISERIRQSDFIARFGGEEFVILMPNTDEKSAFIVMEKIRTFIHQSNFRSKGERVAVTMSFGISQFKSGDQPDKVFERADKALYKAKNDGRNQCKVAA